MDPMIEKGMDICLVVDLNPFRDSGILRDSFLFRFNLLLCWLGTLGPGFFISVFLLDGPFEETFTKHAESDEDNVHYLRQRYFQSLCDPQETAPYHSAGLYENAENAIREIQNEEPYISFDTHSFYITATPVKKCCQDEFIDQDCFRADSSRHLYLLGMDKDDACMTAEKTGCKGFFRYDLDTDGIDECFDDLFDTLKAVSSIFTRTIVPMEYSSRAGWYAS